MTVAHLITSFERADTHSRSQVHGSTFLLYCGELWKCIWSTKCFDQTAGFSFLGVKIKKLNDAGHKEEVVFFLD